MRPAQGRLGAHGLAQQGRKKFEPPRPVQLGSLKSENEGQDPGIRLVPSGGRGWCRPVKEESDEDFLSEEEVQRKSELSKDPRESPSLRPKPREPAKPKFGNLNSATKRSVWDSGGPKPWNTVVAAPAPARGQASPATTIAGRGRMSSGDSEADERGRFGSSPVQKPSADPPLARDRFDDDVANLSVGSETQEEQRRKALRRQMERQAEEEERQREQYAKAQEKLRQLEERKREQLAKAAQEKLRPLEQKAASPERVSFPPPPPGEAPPPPQPEPPPPQPPALQPSYGARQQEAEREQRRQQEADEQIARALQDELARHVPSLTGETVWGVDSTTGAQSMCEVDDRFPSLDKDAGPQKKKERKQLAALAAQVIPASAPVSQASRAGSQWNGAAGDGARYNSRNAMSGPVNSRRAVPTGTFNLKDLAKPAKKRGGKGGRGAGVQEFPHMPDMGSSSLTDYKPLQRQDSGSHNDYDDDDYRGERNEGGPGLEPGEDEVEDERDRNRQRFVERTEGGRQNRNENRSGGQQRANRPPAERRFDTRRNGVAQDVGGRSSLRRRRSADDDDTGTVMDRAADSESDVDEERMTLRIDPQHPPRILRKPPEEKKDPEPSPQASIPTAKGGEKPDTPGKGSGAPAKGRAGKGADGSGGKDADGSTGKGENAVASITGRWRSGKQQEQQAWPGKWTLAERSQADASKWSSNADAGTDWAAKVPAKRGKRGGRRAEADKGNATFDADASASSSEQADEGERKPKGAGKSASKGAREPRWVAKAPEVCSDGENDNGSDGDDDKGLGKRKRRRKKKRTGSPSRDAGEEDGVDDAIVEDARSKEESSQAKKAHERKPREVGQETIQKLRAVGDTGLAVGAGVVSVITEPRRSDSDDDDDVDEFETVKTKKQQKTDRQEQRRLAEEEARKEMRREARRQQQQRRKDARRLADDADADRADDVAKGEPVPAPKRAVISLAALKRELKKDVSPKHSSSASAENNRNNERAVSVSSGSHDFSGDSLSGSERKPSQQIPQQVEVVTPATEWVPQLHPAISSASPRPSNQASDPFASMGAHGGASFAAPDSFAVMPSGYPVAAGGVAESVVTPFSCFPFGVGTVVQELGSKPSREISEIWERPAGLEIVQRPLAACATANVIRRLCPHGPPPPYKPPPVGRADAEVPAVGSSREAANRWRDALVVKNDRGTSREKAGKGVGKATQGDGGDDAGRPSGGPVRNRQQQVAALRREREQWLASVKEATVTEPDKNRTSQGGSEATARRMRAGRRGRAGGRVKDDDDGDD